MLPKNPRIIGSMEGVMSTVEAETSRALGLLSRVEAIERVARSFSEHDPRRSELMAAVESDLADAAPLRPRIAAQMLKLSERTVRAWVQKGVLKRADVRSPRLLLDVGRLHEVFHLVHDIRDQENPGSLLEEVLRRLVDATWLDREDLAESLDQMTRCEGTIRVPKPSA